MILHFIKKWLVAGLCLWSIVTTGQSTLHTDQLEQFIREKASPSLKNMLDHPETYQFQVIFTSIKRDAENQPKFTHQYLRVNDSNYFNPASMVKLPTALLALEKMEELNAVGVGPLTLLRTDTSTAPASFLELVRRAFIVSDNEAYNRLFQFVGQERLNNRLQEMGYTKSRITRRFIPLTPEQHRLTEPVEIVSADSVVLYSQPLLQSKFSFDFSRRLTVGKAHYNWEDSLIQEPMDFTTHNLMPLRDLQQILQAVLFPASVPERQRFRISEDSRRLVLDALADLPSASTFPRFDTTEFFDSYTKFFLYRDGRQKIPANMRVFNKTGWSYGYLIDVAYIVDKATNREAMLSGVIYVNSDNILNDNRYEYDSIGYPFFREIGEILFSHPTGATRPVAPVGWRGPAAITRGDSTRKELALVFTGHEFAEGGSVIDSVLAKHGVKASFFFTGDFYRNAAHRKLIGRLARQGHYLGAHGDKHLLYNDWSLRDSLLVSKAQFISDLRNNERAMEPHQIDTRKAQWFLPSYEWYNDSIIWWTNELGRKLVSYTPGTISHADYTTTKDKNYRSSANIFASIKEKEARDGLNGYLLLLHIGAGPHRPDPFYLELDRLINLLKTRGYSLLPINELLHRSGGTRPVKDY